MNAQVAPAPLPKVGILHDGNTVHPWLVDLFDQLSSVTQFGDNEIPSADNDSELWVAIASLREHAWLNKVQKKALAQNKRLLVVGLEPSYIWLGPLVAPQHSGCFNCMKLWAYNNNQQATHWAAMTNDDAARPGMLPAPLAAPTSHIIKRLLTNAIQRVFDDEPEFLKKETLRFDLVNTRTSSHRFIPVHDCAVCASLPDNSAELAEIELTPRLKAEGSISRVENKFLDLKKLKSYFSDRHIGMVKHVYHNLNSDLMPMYSAEFPIMYTKETENGYGRCETNTDSEKVSILETIERYAGHSPKAQKTVVRASYNQVKDNALDPRSLILHEPSQKDEPGYILHPYTDDFEFGWYWCRSLVNNESILVPEQSIFYYLLNKPGAPLNRFIYETSNGCALGGAVEEAIFYGLLELVERDAYLTTWYGRFTPTEIDLHSLEDPRIKALLDRVEAKGLELHAFDMRVGIDIPVVWCMIVDPASDAPVKSYCAAGAHLVPEQAIYSGLIEVTTSMSVYQESMPPLKERALEMLADDFKVQDMHDHVLLYSLPETYERLSFLFSDKPKKTVQELYGDIESTVNRDITEDLKALMEKVKVYADDIIVADLTFPELEPHQLHCVKVIAPGLMPVTFGHQYRRISLERINRFAEASGRKPFRDTDELNPYPHNFP